MLRRLAMDERDDEEAASADDTASTEFASSVGDPADYPSKTRKSVEVVNKIQKVTKHDRLSLVMGSLSESIKSSNHEDSLKYEYKKLRLEHEREQAQKQRGHDIQMEERRVKAEDEKESESRRQRRSERKECSTFCFLHWHKINLVSDDYEPAMYT